MALPDFDLIIIGTGVAGRTAVEEAAHAGLRTAIVDRRPFGGTCALRGCEPKKLLFAAAEACERVTDQAGNGVAGQARLNWGELVTFERTFIDPLPVAFERAFRALGATPLHGTARFVSPDAVEIDGTRLTFGAALVATGARPAALPFPGSDLLIDSEAFMLARSLPERVAFVGGGYISIEFAHMAAAAGCSVTVLHRGPHVLGGFDPDLADLLARGYRERGIDVRTGVAVTAVTRAASGAFEIALGDRSTVGAGLVVHGAGRVPDLDALDLPAAGIASGPRGVEVDSSCRSTSNPRVFAAGDASALGAPLTPVAAAQARTAVRNIASPGSATFDPAAVPSVVFAAPPLASVGLTESEAAERGLDVTVKFTDTSGWMSTRRVGLTVSGAKTLVDRGSGRIVGAHLLGHGADEAINVLTAAIVGGLTVEQLKAALWAYPTAGSELVYLL